jgi:hypothetical protein
MEATIKEINDRLEEAEERDRLAGVELTPAELAFVLEAVEW